MSNTKARRNTLEESQLPYEELVKRRRDKNRKGQDLKSVIEGIESKARRLKTETYGVPVDLMDRAEIGKRLCELRSEIELASQALQVA